MRNKLLISGLILLLITALIVSASAVDVISVSELFSFGGDSQEDVAAEVYDAPEDTYTEDTSAPAEEDTPASDPAQESGADDAYIADDTDPDNTDNIADDTTGAPADGETPDENTPDTDIDPEDDADLTASGELENVEVPEQDALAEMDASEQPEDRSSDWIVHITNDVQTKTSGVDSITRLEDVPEDLQERWSELLRRYNKEGMYVEVPVYISLENNSKGTASRLTGAYFGFFWNYSPSDYVVYLDPKIEVDGFNVGRSGALYTVTYNGSLDIPDTPLKIMTLRYYLPMDLYDGKLFVTLYADEQSGVAIQYGDGQTTTCNFYSSFEYEGDTLYQIMGVDTSGWAAVPVEVTHTHVLSEFRDDFNEETKPATCTEDGLEAALCSNPNCEYNNEATPYYQPIPKLGHTRSKEAAYSEPLCDEVGHIAYVYCEACNHFIDPDEFEDNIYTDKYLFEGKDYDEDGNLPEYVPMTGHVKTEEAGHVPSTCSVQGHESYVYCEKCNRFIVPEDFADDIYTKNYRFDGAGYTADGKLPQYLELDEENHVDALTEIPYVAPNCYENSPGRNPYWQCKNCGKYYTDQAGTRATQTTVAEQVIEPNHDTELVAAVAADCDSYGTIEYHQCKVCGEKFTTENPAGGLDGALQSVANPAEPPLGHEWELTETETGYEAACPVCGETLVVTAIVGSQNNADLASKGLAQYQGFEIAIYDAEGNPIEPDTPIPVSIPLPEGFDVSRCVVYFVEEDGSLTELEYTYADGYLIVSVSHSGIYFVGEEAVAASGSGRYAPNTDDGNSPFLWMTLVFFGLSLAGLAAATVGRRKYNR